MGRRGRLLTRGARWRLGGSLLTVLAATIAVATAVLGPLYLHSAESSVVHRVISRAPVQSTGTTLPLLVAEQDTYGIAEHVTDAARRIGGRERFFGSPIISIIDPTGAGSYTFSLISRTGVCGHLHLVAGRCALGIGDAIMSARTAHKLRVSLGSTISVPGTPTVDGAPSGDETLHIIGIYAIPDISDSYWWGGGSSDFAYGQPQSNKQGPPLDAVFASTATALRFPSPRGHAVVGEIPLRPGSLGLGDEAALGRAQQRLDTLARSVGAVPVSQLSAVLAGVESQQSEIRTIVAVAAVQLVLLAIWVLAGLLVRSAEARQSEARAARLRGFPTRSLLWVTVAEPALLCLVGAALGVAIAWVVVLVMRSSLLVRGTPIAFDGWALSALAVTLVAIVGALAVGTRRLLRSSRLSQGTTVASEGSTAGRLVDVGLVVIAIIALLELGSSVALTDHASPIAAAAPGLIALGVAVVAVQAILFACRLGVARTRDGGRIATFLALRQTARRPGLLRQARVLVIALGLACFATAAWSVARSNRASIAAFQVGADTVVTVAPTSPVTLQQAVDRVDPHGRYAMASIDVQGQHSSLLAVQAPRLPAVAAWPHGLSARSLGSIARALDPHTAPAVTLPQSGVEVEADVAAHGAIARRLSQVVLDLWVQNAASGTNILQLPALHAGAGTYAAPLGVTGLGSACPGGCRLVGVGVAPPGSGTVPAAGAVSVTISRMTSGGRPLAADLTAGDWRSGGHGVEVADANGGLSFAIPAAAIVADSGATGGVTPPMASVADHPALLPAVISQALESTGDVKTGVVSSIGLDAEPVSIAPVATVPGVPQLGGVAAMVDLPLLARAQVQATDAHLSDQVWLAHAAPADTVRRLRAAGLQVTGVHHASSVDSTLGRTGPALADDFLLLAAIAALFVAAASTLGSLGTTTRERATELTSLRITGVPRTAIVRALALEAAILLLTALCGAGAGILATELALPSLPERANASLVPEHIFLPVLPIIVVTLIVLLVVALATAGVAATLLGRMSPTLLRTAPDDIS